MAKNVAVLAVNPVNGLGLFQYLEAFYENKIPYTLFAVSETTALKSNSGVALRAEKTVADLKGREAEFDAVVFACGDAVPVFARNADKPWNRDLLEILGNFGRQGKLLIGHCGAGMMFGFAGAADGKRVAVHPLAKGAVRSAIATDAPCEIDGNLFTAQQEHTLPELLPRVLEALR